MFNGHINIVLSNACLGTCRLSQLVVSRFLSVSFRTRHRKGFNDGNNMESSNPRFPLAPGHTGSDYCWANNDALSSTRHDEAISRLIWKDVY